jgi:pyrimidine and pyridine-specific 5'-nucleotidase
MWHIPNLTPTHAFATPGQALPIETSEVIPAKAVSCLDYCPKQGVLAAGFHDTGRVQVWKRGLGGAGGREGFQVLHTLNGHLHGIRAIAWVLMSESTRWSELFESRRRHLTLRISAEFLVPAGADKAIVVWHWP